MLVRTSVTIKAEDLYQSCNGEGVLCKHLRCSGHCLLKGHGVVDTTERRRDSVVVNFFKAIRQPAGEADHGHVIFLSYRGNACGYLSVCSLGIGCLLYTSRCV